MVASSSDKLTVEVSEHTALIRINNPPGNTWDLETLQALRSLMEQLNLERSIYSLVLTGSGEKFMSAGADLKMIAAGGKSAAADMASHFGAAFSALARFRGVSIAAINGYAFGGGLECAMACDIRICSTSASLALPEAAVGLLPCAGGTHLLKKLVGEAWAKRMILFGERVDAETALRIGLVQEVTAPESLLARALALAKQASRQSPVSVEACKQLITDSAATLEEALAFERIAYARLFDGPDQKEGVSAFLEKRLPRWSSD
ncbi:MAG: enoyl-CoA hydratase [Chromatiaceae bacterium]|nr:enoyl-CoA hydratase [Chromatiaceae bacterium]